ncbi:MYG1 family protein [Criblamydia sequanensis]|uniref:Uncharacterized protein n=1 Tax=Candidatus Criblamydia sequanensis CRIB-18 TaxID=1437425 RepID=A0A090D220_9BACT|nr:MYG1 family protein [Criblamydia sequanensis]CDR33998.1 Conserved hypothetical protein [Criblamydia sequanensis CRIB-18]
MGAQKIPRSCGIHDGTFHADEVTACALLIIFNLIDQDKIKRTRSPEILSTCEYVCDVGGVYDPDHKLFDHHQVEYQGPLSSAGMILLYLKNKNILSQEEYNQFNNNLVIGVDDHDNGVDPQLPGISTYSHIMANFTPIHHDASEKENEEAFFKALEFAKGHLQRMWDRYNYNRSCREIVAQAMQEKKVVLMFDKAIPWMDAFFALGGTSHPAKFVIMPSGKHWKLRGIPPTIEDKMDVRMALPKEWAGLLDEELKRKSGIAGAIFCHKGRFISVWETREDALKALEYTLKGC